MRAPRLLGACFILFLGSRALAGAEGALSIAAASNLTFAIQALDAEFGKESPGVHVSASMGASGGIVAQIGNGAPYDVFLSADLEYPQALVKGGHALASSLTPFAVGRLVLWTVKPGIDVSDVAALVRNPAVHAIAIANPDSAPYGRAARQALVGLGIWSDARAKVVTAENISQAAQFVGTGNADAGFVALSAVVSPGLKGKGTWREVPASEYDPILQAAVITTHGSSNPEAARYLAFLRSDAAKAILRDFGYGIP